MLETSFIPVRRPEDSKHRNLTKKFLPTSKAAESKNVAKKHKKKEYLVPKTFGRDVLVTVSSARERINIDNVDIQYCPSK
jgi:hypothetical protein